MTSPTLENGADTLGVVTNPSFAFWNGMPIYDTDIAITTSGFEADIIESGLRRGAAVTLTKQKVPTCWAWSQTQDWHLEQLA